MGIRDLWLRLISGKGVRCPSVPPSGAGSFRVEADRFRLQIYVHTEKRGVHVLSIVGGADGIKVIDPQDSDAEVYQILMRR